MDDFLRIDAVAFDCDGLMFNTEESFNIAGRELLRRRGHVLTPDVLRLMMGRRAEEAFAALIDALSLQESPDTLRAEYQQLFLEALDGNLAPMPGLYELLSLIEDLSLPMAVCTSSTRTYLDEILRRFDLTHRFAVTFTADDVNFGKPHPEIYQKAADGLGVPTHRMMVLEDSENGTKSAASAGAIAVSVPHEHSSTQDFSAANLVAKGLSDPRIAALLRNRGADSPLA